MRIKIFQYQLGYSEHIIESEINEWLNINKIDIKELKQSYTTDDRLVYTFLYYDKKEIRKLKIDKINEL